MENQESGTLAKKRVLFLCKHNAASFTHIVPKTERKYRFEKGHPYLVKYEEDIEYFRNHDLFAEWTGEIKEDPMVEKMADKAQEVMEEDAKEHNENVDKESEENVKPEKVEEVKIYSKEELNELKKSEQAEIIKSLNPNKDIPIRKYNRVNLILEMQEKK